MPGRISLLVRNLRYETSPDRVRKYFSQFGEVRDVYLPLHYHTKRPRGFGFVEFFDERDAQECLRNTHHTNLDGNEISVTVAQQGRKSPETMRHRETRTRDGDGAEGGGGGRRRRYSRSRSPSRDRRDGYDGRRRSSGGYRDSYRDGRGSRDGGRYSRDDYGGYRNREDRFQERGGDRGYDRMDRGRDRGMDRDRGGPRGGYGRHPPPHRSSSRSPVAARPEESDNFCGGFNETREEQLSRPSASPGRSPSAERREEDSRPQSGVTSPYSEEVPVGDDAPLRGSEREEVPFGDTDEAAKTAEGREPSRSRSPAYHREERSPFNRPQRGDSRSASRSYSPNRE